MAVNAWVYEGQELTNEALGNFFSAMMTGGDVSAPSATQGVFMHPGGGPGDQFVGSGTSSPVSIGTGWAIVANRIIQNDAAASVSVSTPSGSARKDRIILRYTYGTHTADIALITSAEGAADYADYTAAGYQTAGTVWCIPLYKVDITTGGVITLTDERYAVNTSAVIAAANIASNAITNVKLRDSNGSSVIGRSATTTGDPADIIGTDAEVLHVNPSTHLVEFGTLTTNGITDDAVTDAKLRNSNGSSVIGRSATSSGNPADITGTDAQVLHVNPSSHLVEFGTITTAGITDDAVTAAKIADGAIDAAAKLGSGVVTEAKIGTGAVTADKIGTGAVTEAKLGTGAVTADKIGADAVAVAKIGTMVLGFLGRQGGNATNWHIAGTNNYTTAVNVRIQCGSEVGATLTVTFPTAFSAIPIVFVTPYDYLGAYYVSAISASAFTIVNPQGGNWFWLAIGPE